MSEEGIEGSQSAGPAMGTEYASPGPDGTRARALRARLHGDRPLLLDGATGTELERRGLHTGLPLWSTHALLDRPDAVAEIHAAYVAAGAEWLTANTFRTQRRTLASAGLEHRDAELTRLAVSLAREAAGAGDVFVAGSAPPLEDCYSPDRVPPDEALEREHARHAENLAAAGCDVILVETMNTIREARIAALAAAATGLPVVASFCCGQAARLLSGEPLSDACRVLSDLERPPLALGVNCLPPSAVAACLPVLAECGLPFGVYANLGAPHDATGITRSEDLGPQAFADCVEAHVAAGARFVGGCCGTGPEHVRAIAVRLDRG